MKVPIVIFAILIGGLSIALLNISPNKAEQPQEEVQVKVDYPKHINKFIGKYCTDCHDEDIQKGGVDLSSFSLENMTQIDEDLWAKVYHQVESGTMPPKKKKKQPTTELRHEFTNNLSEHLNSNIRTKHEMIGRTVIRRLTREEYENTLKDLFEIEDLEIKEFLPPDQKSHGFDNIAHSQNLSHVQIARYLEAADFILDRAMNPQPKPEYKEWDIEAVKAHRFNIGNDAIKKDGKIYMLRQPNSAQTPWYISDFKVHYSGEYKLKMWTYGTEVKSTGKGKETKLSDEKKTDKHHVLMFYANPSKNVLRKQGNVNVPPNKYEAPVSIHLNLIRGEKPLFQIATMSDRAYGTAIAVEKLQMTGPHISSWPPASHKLLFGDLQSVQWDNKMKVREPLQRYQNFTGIKSIKRQSSQWMVVSDNPEQDAEELLYKFMQKAIRRPVERSEVAPYLELVKNRLKENYCFQDSMKTGYKAILCSPDFLYFQENFGNLSDDALASRLSYFLWKSMPDKQLTELARNGKLKNDAILKSQVNRMLADKKSKRFIHSFIDQWLELENINLTIPDSKLFPEFDDWLQDCIARETYEFFTTMVKENLSPTHLVDSDFLVVNQRLAQLYELDKIDGDKLRKVKIPKDHIRGGLLTQASILKITANGTTTSPVIRGAWVTEKIIGKHIPPPPPNAGSVEPDTRGATTIRELLDKHRNNSSCIGCHQLIDPPGFALESFNPMGAYRERYRNLDKGDKVKKRILGKDAKYKLKLDVDSTGETVNGTKFTTINEFRELLLKDKKGLAKNVTEKLLTFATGSQVHFTDAETIEEITKDADVVGIKDIIHGIVQSKIFRRK
ncbi:MAG: DUF1592 domain-containing protein [Lentisphaeraceae bacterium]|nr:DUF1592 domain-containing protein [Lentisphaeraceae bacterium]